MKVGTDGVLLGAWCMEGAEGHIRVLDVGTGSGLVALMIAQRFADADICGIDIDADAVAQAADNFAASPWKERLATRHCSFAEMAEKNERWNAIVSNPPYFSHSLLNPSAGRTLARHSVSLTLEDLVSGSARMLKYGGSLSLVLPAEQEEEANAVAVSAGLCLTRLTKVFTKAGKPQKRSLMEWRKLRQADIGKTEVRTLCLQTDSSLRSEEYASLTQDFYL